jgi:hypothetical protein
LRGKEAQTSAHCGARSALMSGLRAGKSVSLFNNLEEAKRIESPMRGFDAGL